MTLALHLNIKKFFSAQAVTAQWLARHRPWGVAAWRSSSSEGRKLRRGNPAESMRCWNHMIMLIYIYQRCQKIVSDKGKNTRQGGQFWVKII